MNIIDEECDILFLRFCGLICLLQGKKLNIPNIFLNVLKNDAYRQCFKKLLDIETDYGVVQFFNRYDTNLWKSKYVSKFLNSSAGAKFVAKMYR